MRKAHSFRGGLKAYDNMPDWAKPTMQKLIDRGALKGDEKGQLMLTGTMLRLFVIHDRIGVYDK